MIKINPKQNLQIISFVTFLSFFLISNIYHISKTYASNGIEISPASETLSLKPGNNSIKSFIIKNNDAFDVAFNIKLGEIIDNITLLENFPNDNSANWVKINNTLFTLKVGESKEITYTLNIPNSSPNGIYYPLIAMHITQAQLHPLTDTALLDENIAYKLKIQVSNDTSNFNAIKISTFNINKTLVIDNQCTFNIILENANPKQFSKPIIYFHILDANNSIITQSIINEGLDSLNLDQKWEKNFNIDFSQLKINSIGQFKSEILVVDTITNKSLIQKVSFYFIPSQYILITFIIITILIVLLLKVRASRKKNNN